MGCYLLSTALFVDSGYLAGKEVIIGFLAIQFGIWNKKIDTSNMLLFLIWLVMVYGVARSFIVK